MKQIKLYEKKVEELKEKLSDIFSNICFDDACGETGCCDNSINEFNSIQLKIYNYEKLIKKNYIKK